MADDYASRVARQALMTQPPRQMDPLVAAQQGNRDFIAANPDFTGITPYFNALDEAGRYRGPNIVNPRTQAGRQMDPAIALYRLLLRMRADPKTPSSYADLVQGEVDATKALRDPEQGVGRDFDERAQIADTLRNIMNRDTRR